MSKGFSTVLTVAALFLTLTLCSTSLYPLTKVGESVLSKVETAHPYRGGNGVVFQQKFKWDNAGYISIHFRNFDLAPGDYVEVSSPDGKFVYTYSGRGKKVADRRGAISDFWATHIPGDTAIVKLVSRDLRSSYGFDIDQWVHGYEQTYLAAIMEGLEIEAICSSDDKEWAKCYDGSVMYDKSRAVCRLLIGGSSACTGWLVGSEGHVMTNNHCIGSQGDADNTDFEFMAEGGTCGTDCGSWGACPGIVEAASGTLVKNDNDLDYALILLPTNVTSTYGYFQLRDATPTIGEGIYIPQHPGAYGKQLAVLSDVDGPYAKIFSIDETPCIGGPGDIGYYADTAGGSSGSPVVSSSDQLVVALHHCANCPNRGVPIPPIIAHLGADLPADAVGVPIPMPPTANFIADRVLLQVGGTVQFNDLSGYNPTSWSWTFEGGAPATSTEQNPQVVYNTVGTYSVTLTVTNAEGSDTEVKTDYIVVQTDPVAYCDSQGNNSSYEWISEVQFGSFVNASGAAGYTDFTNLSFDLTGGETVDVTLTPEFAGTIYTEYWRVWIDYNRDSDFEDAGEEVFAATGTTVVTGSFTVPDDFSSGNTRMRVSMKWNDVPTPCEAFGFGEVEDYTVHLGEAVGSMSNYALFGTNSVHLRTAAKLLSGDVGVIGVSSTFPYEILHEFSTGDNVQFSDGTSIYANRIKLKPQTSVDDVYYNDLINLGEVRGTETTPLELPLVVTLPEFPTPAPGSTVITVPDMTAQFLAAGSYGGVEVGRQAILILTGGTYHFESLTLQDNAEFHVQAASEIIINGRLWSGENPKIIVASGAGISAKDIVFYVNGVDDGEIRAVTIGIRHELQANIYAPNGMVWLKARGHAEGAFIGYDVMVDFYTEITLNSIF